MGNFVIVADSTCDLSKEYCEKYDINIVYGHVVFPDKGELRAFLDWEMIGRDEFYNALKANPDGYKTSPPNMQEFYEVFEKYAQDGKDVLCMTISGGISGAPGFAMAAAKMIEEEYPNVSVKVLDTMRFGPGFGLMAVHASMLREEGKSITEVYDYFMTNRNRYHQAGWLDDLSFVAKKGRITHAKAFMGTLVGMKPIGEFDGNGLTTVIGKVKGTKTAYKVLLEYIEKTIENPQEQYIFIAHTCRYQFAEEYKALIEEKFKPKGVFINDVFPVNGINIGPGLMAAYYVGTPISDDLSKEREIIEKAQN